MPPRRVLSKHGKTLSEHGRRRAGKAPPAPPDEAVDEILEAAAIPGMADAGSAGDPMAAIMALLGASPEAAPPPRLTKKDAARQLLRIKNAEETLAGFAQEMRHIYTPPERLNDPFPSYQLELIRQLQWVLDTPGARLLVTMPPRHLKTTLASHLLPAYALGKHPRWQIMQVTYGQEFARDFGKMVKRIVDDPLYKQTFDNTRVDPSASANDKWATTDGGWYFSVGIGGVATGRGANLLIIDDPIKNREDAESILYRNKVWQEYVATFSTRHLEGGRTVVILTRWHPDDLAGRLMASENWTTEGWRHVNFQAIRTIDTEIEIPRHDLPPEDPRHLTKEQYHAAPGHARMAKLSKEVALWPEVYPLDRLRRQKALDEREFEALYQQSPFIKGGNLIKDSWWQWFDRDELLYQQLRICAPMGIKLQRLVIGVDTAFKDKETNDPSVFATIGLAETGDIYIADIIRQRLLYPDLKRLAIQTNARLRGRGLAGFYIEDKASGQSLIQDLKREPGLSVIPHKMPGDKVAKTRSVSPLIEGGRVYLPREAPWLEEFVQECTAFPNATHDDQVDALTIALDAISRISLTDVPQDFAAPLTAGY
ncbi:MAG: phage terminase large subunit, partial [Brevundimonas sp.]|nr:phage terminase large subunit [Brevundimonas sp.]